MDNVTQGSAARRREEDQQQQHTDWNRGTRSRARRTKRMYWLLAGIVGLVIVAVTTIVVVSNVNVQQAQLNSGLAYQTVTTIPAAMFAQVGTGSVSGSPMTHVSHAALLKGAHGKPEIIYIGGEFCPICAAQRYVVLAALSRFGTFKHVSALSASEGSISTFSFEGASYSSDYISLDAKEAVDNNHKPLDKLSDQELTIAKTYNKPPYVVNDGINSIPFMSIANQYVSDSSYYDDTLLGGKSYTDIANQLKDSGSDIGRGVIGGANYLTAAICSVTHDQPANVCSTSYIPALQQTLQKTTAQQDIPAGNSALAQAALPAVLDLPRRS